MKIILWKLFQNNLDIVELLSTNYFIFYITIKITMDGNETILSQK